MVYRVNGAISLIAPHFFFQFQISDQPYRQTSTLSHETIPSNLTPAQTTTSEYHNRPSSDPPNQTIRTDHHRQTRQPDQIRSPHQTTDHHPWLFRFQAAQYTQHSGMVQVRCIHYGLGEGGYIELWMNLAKHTFHTRSAWSFRNFFSA